MTTSAAPVGPSTATSRDRHYARGRVVAAARALFAEAGVRPTTMTHVARRVGTSRQTVYNLFLGRRELVEAAVLTRIEELADAVNWPKGDLVATFTETSVTIVEALREDGELRVLLGEGSPITLHEALWMDSVRARSELFFRPWFARAREEGRLRDDVSEESISDWLDTVYGSMVLRTTMEPEDMRRLVERFVLPSILRAPA